MVDSVQVSYADAKVCPKCGLTGEEGGSTGPDNGIRTIRIYCRNRRCVWGETFWIVELAPDGTVRSHNHTPHSAAQEKNFERLPNFRERKRKLEDSLEEEKARQRHADEVLRRERE